MKEWLDRIIAIKQQLAIVKDSLSELITICENTDYVHVYSGIEKLAAELKIPLIYDPTWSEDRGCAYFYYEGYKVFQLWDKNKTKEDN